MNIVLDGGPDPPHRRGEWSWGNFCLLWTHNVHISTRLKLDTAVKVSRLSYKFLVN